MTHPNDQIVPVTMRQIGDNDYRIATPKDLKEGMFLTCKEGLTKREYFAAMLPCPEEEVSKYVAEQVMGYPPPNTDENFMYWINARAKYSVLRADALINALNQQP